MSRRKKNKFRNREQKNNGNDFEDDSYSLHPDTKKGVWAIIFLGVSAILLLARFGGAGPIGKFFYGVFNKLFGVGYYLLPLIFLVMAIVFLTSERRKISRITFIGAFIFVIASLGLIDIVFSQRSGLIGSFIGALEIPFGYTASLVIVIVAVVSSFLVTLNLPIKFRRKKKDEEIKKEIISEEVEKSIIAAEINNSKNEESRTQETLKDEEIKEDSSSLKEKIFPLRSRISFKNYVPPPLSLLKSSVEKPTAGDLRANANIIKRTLEGFGIPVEMGEVNIGPKVTRYTLKPAEGVKLSRIIALNQDLALALAAHPIRIEAPIPGKSLVGIEVPNKAAAIVRLGSLMSYPEFAAGGFLGFVLGRDVSGDPIFADIDKMPHLLIAGSSGSGKSIVIHSLLTSLLYKNSPETLRLILVDPKRVELSLYEGLPHLVSPVITEPKKTVGVFKWAIEEMSRRYDVLLGAGSRDIGSYNKKNPEEPLPYIVIVVDELADLMVTYGREVEASIVRLAQMARATGLHLVVSTQRPSVEVVTGLIKANITSRIALQLPSQIDSRTVLDTSGAEKLLGGGDMLSVSSEFSKPRRIQGAYVSEDEVKKVVEFIKDNNRELVEGEEEVSFESAKNGNGQMIISNDDLDKYSNDDDDNLIKEAIRVVVESKKASASLLQRRLKVGYARAARLLDIMEERGIIGPGEGAKPRDVYIDKIPDSD